MTISVLNWCWFNTVVVFESYFWQLRWLGLQIKLKEKNFHRAHNWYPQAVSLLLIRGSTWYSQYMQLHCLKKRPPWTCYNLDIHDPITIIFGKNVTKKVGNQIMLCLPTSPHISSGSALPCETGNPEIASFHLNIVCYFSNEHTEHIQIITWSQLNNLHSQSDRLYTSDN